MVLTKLRMTVVLLLSVGIAVGTAAVSVLAQQNKETDDPRAGGTATAPSRQVVPAPEVTLGGDGDRQGIRFPRNFPGATKEDTGDSPADQRDGSKKETISRSYYIGDLVLPRGPVPRRGSHPEVDGQTSELPFRTQGGVPRRGVYPEVDGQPQIDLTPVIELIAGSVAPGTWKGYDKRGKPKQATGEDDKEKVGSITPFYLSISLIIRHTEAGHDQVADRLRQLRRLLLLDVESPAAAVSESGNRQLNAAPPTAPGSESGVENRLREVERKLDRVLKAVESSRRDAGDGRQPF